MDNTTNIFKQLTESITPFISFVVGLIGYIWLRQIKDFRDWLTTHNTELDELRKEQRHILTYVNDELKEMTKQERERDLMKNDRLNETREDMRALKSELESMKIICNVRHGK